MSQNASSTQDQSSGAGEVQKWGRVLICGGVDWSTLGRKDKRAAKDESENPDLLEPHILRSLANVRIKSIHASGSGCHIVCIDIHGTAWMFGRNSPAALGRAMRGEPVQPTGVVNENTPRRITPQMLGAPKGTTFVHAATGRSHTLLVGSNGDVWSAGANQVGQCGLAPCSEVASFTLIRGPWPGGEKEHIVKVGAGVSFSILLTASGKLYALGSGEHGQLGNGRTGEHIATGNKTQFDVHSSPVAVRGLEDKVITQFSCGHQHTIALDKEGIVYVWGYNGYCRLGLGNQQDVLIPKTVPQFAGPNINTRATFVSAGPTSSVVLDKQGMYYMAGKWKNSGDGSSGSPFSTFRFIQDITGVKVYHACSGGVTHFALAPEEDGSVLTIGFGQNAANGELGFGPNESKSATKPKRHEPLVGIEIIDIAASQNTTIFLARPNDKYSDLPRHPENVDSAEECVVCSRDRGEDDSPLACDKCDDPYHLSCLTPPLSAVPDGEWFCPRCAESPSVDNSGNNNNNNGSNNATNGDNEEEEESGTVAKAVTKKRGRNAKEDGEGEGTRKAPTRSRK